MKVTLETRGTYWKGLVLDDQGERVPYPYVFWGVDKADVKRRAEERMKELSNECV